MSNVVQREFEAELRAERYKAKYLKTIDVLPKRTGELKQVKADLQDTKAELEESKILNAQLKARNAELEDMRRAVHEQTTRDIVEVRFSSRLLFAVLSLVLSGEGSSEGGATRGGQGSA